MTGHLARLLFLLPVLALLGAPAAVAQGCSMCRDTTAGSPPQIRLSLRRAIPLLGIPAAAIFVGILVLAAKTKPIPDQN